MGKERNPYHDNLGRFTFGPGIIEGMKESQIAKSASEAAERQAEDSALAKHLEDVAFTKRATERFKESYVFMSEKFKSDQRILDGLDLSNPDKVTEYSVGLIHHYNLVAGPPACYAVAGVTSAMFESKNVPYTCYSGICLPKGFQRTPDTKSNHVWVESNGKIYEYFPHHRNEDLGEHTATNVIRKSK